MDALPPAVPGTALRILATADLAATLVPMTTTSGRSGTCDGVAGLLATQLERQPTIWLDAGDLVVGPVATLLGRRPWREVARLPLAAAAAGNHEFDDGVPALLEAAGSLPFPLLCANVDVGLPGSAVVDTAAGPVGVIGLTHPATHRYAPAPAAVDGWEARVTARARDLGASGARWIVALLHDGVDWWPAAVGDEVYDGARHWPIEARADRLERLVAPWASDVDLVLGGHTRARGSVSWRPRLHVRLVGAGRGPAGTTRGAGRAGDRADPRDAVTDPRARNADGLWWNWCRMPAGVSVAVRDPSTVAVLPFVVPRIAHLLGRDLAGERTGTGARDALVRVLPL